MSDEPVEEYYIKERYQEVKDKVEYKEFRTQVLEVAEEQKDNPFQTEEQLVSMVVENYSGRTNIQQTHNNQVQEISSLIEGNGNISIQGRLISISNVKSFKTKKDREGKVANLTVQDKTGKIRVVMWTDNMKYIDRLNEGDIIKVNNLEVKKGYQGDLEVQMRSNSSIQVLPEDADPDLPKYEEEITNLEDIKQDGEYNIIVRITRISTLREIQKDDKTLKIITLDILDKTGSSELTLWNRDTELVETLGLKEGDTVKIIKARAQMRYDKIQLSNGWNGRIIKGDYDVPEYKDEITKLGDATEDENVTIVGVITRIYDTVEFQKKDNTTGHVKSIEVTDDTGSIRVTLWNKETEIQMDKNDIIKIEGGNIEYDDYNADQYRLNTGWNASIIINPDIDDDLREKLEAIDVSGITKIEDVLDTEKEEGRDVDVVGRILSKDEIRTFTRNDESEGQVRSIDLADETGAVKTSLWDSRAELTQSIGEPIKIENARTRIGQGAMELSVGKGARIITPTEEEIKDLPPYKQLEQDRYNDRTVSQLEENDRNIKLRGRITQVNDVNTFTRNDGREGRVRGLMFADETGEIQVSLWDDDTEMPISQDTAVVIENPVVNLQGETLRLSIGGSSTLRKARSDEAELIPSKTELENQLYKEKLIEDIEEDDKHIKVKGVIEEINGDRIIYPMCPNCNKSITMSEEGYICDICGEKIEQPNYLMIISLIIKDETGTIQATFFRKEAEELINTTTEEVVDIFNQTGDETAMSGILEDLVGHEVTFIADSNYNEYDEDIRLNARKVIIVV